MHSEATRKKFEITGTAPPYEPSERPEPHFHVLDYLTAASDVDCSDTHKLYITLGAMEQIAEHIGWGRRTEHNRAEQGGLLLGEVYKDAAQGLTYGVVTGAVEGASAKGSSAYLEMTHETWKEMLDAADAITSGRPDGGLQVIGWYHTHPNDLSVFMSGTDEATQRRLFARDWQFAIVLNPHSRRWRAFYGRDATECRGFVYEGVAEARPYDEIAPEDFAPPGGRSEARQDAERDEGAAGADWVRGSDAPRVVRVRASRTSTVPAWLPWVCLAIMLLVLLLQLANLGLQYLSLCLRS